MCEGTHYQIKTGFVSGQMSICEECALPYLTRIRKKRFFFKICKWLILSPTATNSRIGCAAISASAPCVCLICVCSLAITKHGWGGGSKVGGIWRHKETESCRKYRGKEGCQAGCEKRVTLGNYLPVIRPPAWNTKGRPESRTNSKISSFVLCLTMKSHL